MKHFLGNFCNLLVQPFLNFQSGVVWLFCENNQKWPKTKCCFDTFDIRIPMRRERNYKLLASYKFCAMVNSVFTPRWWCVKLMVTTALILFRQYIQNELFQRKISHTQWLRRASRHWRKEERVIIFGVFSSTTESYMIINNIFKTKNWEEQ